jgi:lipid A disaccharide synthetase
MYVRFCNSSSENRLKFHRPAGIHGSLVIWSVSELDLWILLLRVRTTFVSILSILSDKTAWPARSNNQAAAGSLQQAMLD